MISSDDKMIGSANIYENHVSNAKYHVYITYIYTTLQLQRTIKGITKGFHTQVAFKYRFVRTLHNLSRFSCFGRHLGFVFTDQNVFRATLTSSFVLTGRLYLDTRGIVNDGTIS